jgi:hypothetical protein
MIVVEGIEWEETVGYNFLKEFVWLFEKIEWRETTFENHLSVFGGEENGDQTEKFVCFGRILSVVGRIEMGATVCHKPIQRNDVRRRT